jgi:hypothetical protein
MYLLNKVKLIMNLLISDIICSYPIFCLNPITDCAASMPGDLGNSIDLNSFMNYEMNKDKFKVGKEIEEIEVFYFASLIYLRFAHIHPFRNGNGRAARLLDKWCKRQIAIQVFSQLQM